MLALLALVAAPAAVARSTVTIAPSTLSVLRASGTASDVARKDTRRSCQAGASRSRVRLPGPAAVGETERRSSSVACEQPPRSHVNVAGALNSAEAGAIAAAG